MYMNWPLHTLPEMLKFEYVYLIRGRTIGCIHVVKACIVGVCLRIPFDEMERRRKLSLSCTDVDKNVWSLAHKNLIQNRFQSRASAVCVVNHFRIMQRARFVQPA